MRLTSARGQLNRTDWWVDEIIVAIGSKPADHDRIAFQGILAVAVPALVERVVRAIHARAPQAVVGAIEGQAVCDGGNPWPRGGGRRRRADEGRRPVAGLRRR